jgi:NhaP-type Na+/H+ and K+/H+ antiporter
MFYLDDNYKPSKNIFDKVEELNSYLLPEKTQTRKIVEILKNAVESEESNDKDILYYQVKLSQKRVLYQLLKDERLKKNTKLIDFFKEITEKFLSDLNNLSDDKIGELIKVYKNLLDLIIVKSLEKSQNENQKIHNQNQGFNRPSYWSGQGRRF